MSALDNLIAVYERDGMRPVYTEAPTAAKADLAALRRVEDTARELVRAQHRMRDRYAECDDKEWATLWQDLHKAGSACFEALGALSLLNPVKLMATSKAAGSARTVVDAEHVRSVLVDVCQLIDGWGQKGANWTAWDKEVRARVGALLHAACDAQEGPSALTADELCALIEDKIGFPLRTDEAQEIIEAVAAPRAPAEGIEKCLAAIMGEDNNCADRDHIRNHLRRFWPPSPATPGPIVMPERRALRGVILNALADWESKPLLPPEQRLDETRSGNVADAVLAAFQEANPGRATVRALTLKDVARAIEAASDGLQVHHGDVLDALNKACGFGLAQAEAAT